MIQAGGEKSSKLRHRRSQRCMLNGKCEVGKEGQEMNKVFLIGRLTRDSELRYTQGGAPVASFDLAVNRPFTGQDGKREADFIRIACWNKLAENVNQYTGKGSLVAVSGRLQVRSYQAQDGTKRTAYEVVADSVEFLDYRKSEGAGDSGQDAPII